MHKSFLPLFLTSLLGILSSSFLPHEPLFYQWFGLAAGIIPLGIYHRYLASQKILSPAEVDSVYYFGFLITVITLVATAISIALDSSGKPMDMHWILLQFGLGLVATGAALFARLLLMAKSSSQVEMDVIQSTRELVASVTQVSGEFDRAGYQASAFVEQLEERLEKMLNKTITTYTNAIELTAQKSLDRCAASIDGATEQFSEAISKVLEEVGRIQVEAEAISFSVAAEKMQNFSAQIELSVSTMTERVKEVSAASADGIAELASTTRKVQKLAIDIAAKLEKLEQLQSMLDGILNTSEALGIFKEAAETSALSLSKLRATSVEASRKLDSEVIDPLSESGVASGLLQLTKAFPENAANLASTIGDLTVEASNLSQTLMSHRQRVEQTLASVSSAGDTGQQLKSLDATAKSVTDGMQQLLGSINELKQNLAAASEAAKKIGNSPETVLDAKVA